MARTRTKCTPPRAATRSPATRLTRLGRRAITYGSRMTPSAIPNIILPSPTRKIILMYIHQQQLDRYVSSQYTSQKTKKTKTKQKNEAETEQKTTVGDEMPTAGQCSVHFRTLAIIAVAAACGLQAPVSYPRWMLHLHTSFGTRLDLMPHQSAHCFTAFHPGLLTTPLHLAGSHACRHHGHHQPVDLIQPKLDCPSSSL